MDWFTVDKQGLSRLQKRSGFAWVLHEIVQNAWDQKVTKVHIKVDPIPNTAQVWISCEDNDPKGFEKLSLAWTLYADTTKRGDPTKAGRFTLGEKLVLSLAYEAKIETVSGTVIFDDKGRHTKKSTREQGSKISVRVRMTRQELSEIEEAATLLIPPPGVETYFNGELLKSRDPRRSFEATLPTLHLDGEGILRPTRRKTTVRVYPKITDTAYLYEMGIPVVEIDLPWSVEVAQKALVNADRDNVTPAYKKELTVHVLNAMHDILLQSDAATPVITDTLSDERLSKEAQDAVMTLQWGENRALFDPKDPEAAKRLTAEGYTVIPGASLPKGAAKLMRERGSLQTTHELSPTRKPYSDDPDAKPAVYLPESEWTSGMSNIADYIRALGVKLLNHPVQVLFELNRGRDFWVANYGGHTLVFNLGKLGKSWFENGPTVDMNALIIHEFAHDTVSDHLDAAFFTAVQNLGARMVELALSDRLFFKKFGWGK